MPAPIRPLFSHPPLSNAAAGFAVALFLGGSMALPFSQPWLLIAYGLLTAAMLGVLRHFARLGAVDMAALGLPPTAAPAPGWTLAALPVALTTLMAVGLLSGGLSDTSAENIDAMNETLIPAQGGFGSLIFSFLTIAVVVPVLEELMFRGVLFGFLGRFLGPLATVAATALIFALAHTGALGAGEGLADDLLILASLSLVGLAAGALRLASGSLVPAMTLHAAYNALLFLSWVATLD